MGLDGVELIMSIEKSFGIVIPDDEAGGIRTVGDLHAIVKKRLQPARAELCLTSHAFYRLRSAITGLWGVPRGSVRPEACMAPIVPRARRQLSWVALSKMLDWRLPELLRPRWLERTLLAGFFLLQAVGLAGGLTGSLTHLQTSAVVLSSIPFVWLGYLITRPLAVHLPPGCLTVGETTRTLLSLNFARIAGEQKAWTDEEVWSVLKDLIVARTGVDKALVTPEARFIEDLKID